MANNRKANLPEEPHRQDFFNWFAFNNQGTRKHLRRSLHIEKPTKMRFLYHHHHHHLLLLLSFLRSGVEVRVDLDCARSILLPTKGLKPNYPAARILRPWLSAGHAKEGVALPIVCALGSHDLQNSQQNLRKTDNRRHSRHESLHGFLC